MELYHALNRGVEKRTIFMDKSDYLRFVHNLWEFNDMSPAPEFTHHRDLRNPDISKKKRQRIVDIHGWCLMKNHYHLLLSERREGGLTLFLRKLNVGYANYFNGRHGREGSLFQGRTKKILINNERHFLYILHYIHLNPLDFLSGAEKWREGMIKDQTGALMQVKNYRWSSFQDYVGVRNVPSILTKDLFAEVYGSVEKATADFLQDIDLEPIRQIIAE